MSPAEAYANPLCPRSLLAPLVDRASLSTSSKVIAHMFWGGVPNELFSRSSVTVSASSDPIPRLRRAGAGPGSGPGTRNGNGKTRKQYRNFTGCVLFAYNMTSLDRSPSGIVSEVKNESNNAAKVSRDWGTLALNTRIQYIRIKFIRFIMKISKTRII